MRVGEAWQSGGHRWRVVRRAVGRVCTVPFRSARSLVRAGRAARSRRSGRGGQVAERRDRNGITIAPPRAVAIRERVRRMSWAGWPAAVDQDVVEVLLYV